MGGKAVIKAIRDPNSDAKYTALGSLKTVSAMFATEEAMKTAVVDITANLLIDALRDSNSEVRSAVCAVLEAMGKKRATQKTINALIEAMQDSETNVRYAACRAMKDSQGIVRYTACEALRRIGKHTSTESTTTALVDSLCYFINEKNDSYFLDRFPFDAWSAFDVVKTCLSNCIMKQDNDYLKVWHCNFDFW